MTDDDLENILTQYYRGEVSRANTWRTRMDRTTNWSVVITAAVITWVYSNPGRNHIVLLFGFFLVLVFLVMEARRYRFYDLWRARVRMIEEYFFAPTISDEVSVPKDLDWKKMMSKDLNRPRFKISTLEAIARRLKRIYIWIFILIYLGWIIKLFIHPEKTGMINVIINRASIGIMPGELVFTSITIVTIILIIVTLLELKFEYKGKRKAKGEIRGQKKKISEKWKD